MRLTQRTVVLGILALLSASHRSGAAEFAAAKSYPVGTNPAAVVVGDFNGDGKLDIAALNSGSNNVSVLIGNGDGTFQASKNSDAGGSFATILVGDFNGDGKEDLVLFQPGDLNSVAGSISILFGNGDGTFQGPKTLSLAVSTQGVAAADFNGDKKADLIVSDQDSAGFTLHILIGNGDGAFQAEKTILSGVSSATVLVTDFNNDGKSDLAVITSSGVQALLGNGDGTFQPGGTATVQASFSVNSFVFGDVNGDGKMDLVVDSRMSQSCGLDCGNTTQHVSVFFGQGDGSFGSEIVSYTGVAHHSIVISTSTVIDQVVLGDFNGDGKADVGDQFQSFEIRLSNGDGTFTPPIVFQNSGVDAIAADLNGDKLADVVIPDSQNNVVLVLVNDSPTSGADLDIISSGPDAVVLGVGMNFTYSAEVLNEGPQDATNVVFTDTLPPGVTFVSATSTIGTCTQSQGIVTCDIGSLADSLDAQISIVVTPTATGSITNSMTVSAAQPDLAPANNSATQTDTVSPVFTLTVTKSGNGSGTVRSLGIPASIVCGTKCSAPLLSGAKVNLLQAADPSSFFQGWGGACSSNSACAVTMTSDMTVTATFALNPKLTVKFAGGGSGTVQASDGSLSCSNTDTTCSATYAPGSAVSLSAIVMGGSTFTGWSGACTGTDSSQCSATMNADQTVTATFTPPPDFNFNPASSSLTLQRGQQATDVLSITEQGGFSSAIQLTCAVAGSGPAPMPTCALSPASIPAGANSPSSTLTVSAPGIADFRVGVLGTSRNLLASCFLLGLLGCFWGAQFQKRRRPQELAFALLLAGTTLLAACGSGGNTTKKQVQVYTVTVTGMTGVLQHSTIISVNVQ